jgi:hypothetical protein
VAATPVFIIAFKFPKAMQVFIAVISYENGKEERVVIFTYPGLMPFTDESS